MQLEIPSDGATDINHCMVNYFKSDVIEGWNCTECNQPRTAVKSQRITRSPQVLGDDAASVWKSIFECVARAKDVTSAKRKPEEVTGENSGNLTKKAKVLDNTTKKATEISKFDPFFGPSGGRSESGVCGMRNFTGHICFLNAVIQCLAHINAMRDAFVSNFEVQQLNL